MGTLFLWPGTRSALTSPRLSGSRLKASGSGFFYAQYRFSNGIEVFGGPTYVVSTSNIQDSEGNVRGGSFEPDWTFYDKVVDNTRVRMYLGFNAGVRF